jgi:hypothetical protein
MSLCLTNKALRHEGVWGSECIDPRILDLCTSWRWVVSFTPLPLYPRGKSPRYQLDRILGEPQSPSGRRGEEKILDPTGTRTPNPRSSSQSLYRLRYPGSSVITQSKFFRSYLHFLTQCQPHFRAMNRAVIKKVLESLLSSVERG